MIYYVILAVFIQFLVAYGQYLLKVGSRRLDLKRGFKYNIGNRTLVLAVLLFFSTAVLSIFTMRFMEFSIFYSFTGLNYLFIMLFSWNILKEKFYTLPIMANILKSWEL